MRTRLFNKALLAALALACAPAALAQSPIWSFSGYGTLGVFDAAGGQEKGALDRGAHVCAGGDGHSMAPEVSSSPPTCAAANASPASRLSAPSPGNGQSRSNAQKTLVAST